MLTPENRPNQPQGRITSAARQCCVFSGIRSDQSIMSFSNPAKPKRQHKVIFLDDNAPNHRAKPTKDIVKVLDWEPLAHAAYSPDLAPSDYHLFASLGHALTDQRLTSYENVKSWLEDWLA
ncbi:mariner Mos1 transposase [Trichonephila clavipes]|nr:mariner Mos1 transposase [Trichonephila clavipes]